MHDLRPDFLLESSTELLGSLELSRLNHAANIQKEIRSLLEQLADDLAAALLARWMIENRGEFLRICSNLGQKVFDFPAANRVDGPALDGFPKPARTDAHYNGEFRERKAAI